MAFLDETGLQHYQEAIRPMLVKGYTQEEYNVLSEEEKRGLAVITDAEPEGGGSGGACEEVYSTEETRIGRWIDGKPIYRMVITTTVTIAIIKKANSKQMQRTNGSNPEEKYKREPFGWRQGEYPGCGSSNHGGWLSSLTTFSQWG